MLINPEIKKNPNKKNNIVFIALASIFIWKIATKR